MVATVSSLDAGVCCADVRIEFPTAAGPLRVLKGVDFHAPAGSLTMLVGPSGCGKTTLISIIAGLLRGASGSVRVFDHDVSALSASELVMFRLKNVGFIFQQYNLLAGLSAAENAAVPLVAQGMSWPDATDRSHALLERLGMGPHAGKLPRQLSGGQQQRVAIARALVHEPRLLLCDEPTAALDGTAGRAVMELLKQLAVRPDRAAVVVTHDPRVYAYADLVVHMEDGLVSKTQDGASAAAAQHH
ncbi:MAG: ABC transporter ATP-binding protein [Planctomycetota bacterium]|nr:ABC transporter ATP-binding protein [Planctomycetota bacterium]